MTHDVLHALAGFAAGPVTTTGAVRLVTSLSALDWLSVGMAGRDEPVARILRQQVLDEGGTGDARLFGNGSAPARSAALVNGATSHALDYDDTHFAHIGHPSVAVFPAALAIGELRDLPLVEMLEAALIGMEVSIRVGLWLGRDHYQVGFHQTATAGTFGAAVAAGRLIGLQSDDMETLMGLSATRASGLKAQFGTMGKPYNAGMAASSGVECALLVQRGMDSNPAAFDGTFGFGATHHGATQAKDALDGLGERWLFESVSHKFHACCHGLHAALEAAREIDIAGPEVAEIAVRTHPRWMSVCNQPEPETGLGAKFSYRTVLAMRALGFDTARLDSYSAETCADMRLRSLRDHITVTADDSLTETQAVVSMLKRDGSRVEARHDLLAPLGLAQREERVRTKAAKLIGGQAADEAWSLLRQGGQSADFAALMVAP
ncbi:MmgE/PrpD family protein [Primorskyibacter sp. S87]|uniref:MmgE/PrpD family protein n=1 Tax=Primorskyibacter sp. S87 TaxID=3415126 RepID=UPI003C798EA1